MNDEEFHKDLVPRIIKMINEEIRRTDLESEEISKEQRNKKIALKRAILNEAYIRGLSKAKCILVDVSGYEPTTARGKNE